MTTTHRNRLSCTVSAVASSGLGAFTTSTAQSGFRGFVAADDGKQFDIEIQEGTAWEVRTGCTYAHSGTSLSRGTLEDSSTSSAIAFTSAAIVTECLTAAKGASLEQQLDRGFVFVQNDGSTTQTLSSSAQNKIAAALTTVVFNTNSWWDTINKKFLPTRAGKYFIQAACQEANGSAAVLYPSLWKNGASLLQGGQYAGASNTSAQMAGIVDLNGSTDYVEFYIYASVGAATQPGAANTWFQAIYLGA